MLIAAIMLGRALPITAAQILWINMITAVTLALALAFEPSEKGVMQRPPRSPHKPLLSSFLLWRIFLVSVIILIGTFGLFLYYRDMGSSLEYARTVAVNTLVMFEIFYLFCSRYILHSVFNKDGFFGNKKAIWAIAILIVMQLGFTYLAPFQKLFGTASIDLTSWLLIFVVAMSVLFIIEAEKLAIRHVFKNRKKITFG